MYPDRQLEDNQAYIYIQKTNKGKEACFKKEGKNPKKTKPKPNLKVVFQLIPKSNVDWETELEKYLLELLLWKAYPC